MKTKVSLIPNSDHETKKKQKQKHDMCKRRIQQDFIAKNKQNKAMIRKHTQKWC
jgi:hypothetical protein